MSVDINVKLLVSRARHGKIVHEVREGPLVSEAFVYRFTVFVRFDSTVLLSEKNRCFQNKWFLVKVTKKSVYEKIVMDSSETNLSRRRSITDISTQSFTERANHARIASLSGRRSVAYAPTYLLTKTTNDSIVTRLSGRRFVAPAPADLLPKTADNSAVAWLATWRSVTAIAAGLFAEGTYYATRGTGLTGGRTITTLTTRLFPEAAGHAHDAICQSTISTFAISAAFSMVSLLNYIFVSSKLTEYRNRKGPRKFDLS